MTKKSDAAEASPAGRGRSPAASASKRGPGPQSPAAVSAAERQGADTGAMQREASTDVEMTDVDRQPMEQRRLTWRFSKIAKEVPGGGAGPATMAVGAAELQLGSEAEMDSPGISAARQQVQDFAQKQVDTQQAYLDAYKKWQVRDSAAKAVQESLVKLYKERGDVLKKIEDTEAKRASQLLLLEESVQAKTALLKLLNGRIDKPPETAFVCVQRDPLPAPPVLTAGEVSPADSKAWHDVHDAAKARKSRWGRGSMEPLVFESKQEQTSLITPHNRDLC